MTPETLHLTDQDILLLVCCPLAAAMGSLVQFLIMEYGAEFKPTPRIRIVNDPAIRKVRVALSYFRVLTGGLLGLVFALYFVGTLQPGISPLCKLIAFSVLVGYSAPKIWVNQARAVEKSIEKAQLASEAKKLNPE
jgi:hypothetical protein